MSQGFAREARIGVDLHVGETLYYTANDSFAKADYPGLYGVRVETVGAGGGGGGVAATSSTQAAAAAGGAGGSFARGIVLAADLATSETVTVGAGGAGGTAGANDGTDGAASSFGTHVVGGGGQHGRGTGGASNDQPGNIPGQGSSGNTGDLTTTGQDGEPGMLFASSGVYRAWGGTGGHSVYGGGARGGNALTATGGAGADGGLYGGGGSGAANRNSQVARAGGSGAAGIVIIEVLYERKIAVDEDIHTQYLNDTRHNNAHSAARRERGTSDQTITRASFTVIDYNTSVREDDADGDFTWDGVNFQWDINNAGWYEVSAAVYMELATTYERLVLQIRHNGTGVARNDQGGPGNAVNASTMIYASASDTIDFRIYQDNASAASKDLLADAQSFCTIKKVRE